MGCSELWADSTGAQVDHESTQVYVAVTLCVLGTAAAEPGRIFRLASVSRGRPLSINAAADKTTFHIRRIDEANRQDKHPPRRHCPGTNPVTRVTLVCLHSLGYLARNVGGAFAS